MSNLSIFSPIKNLCYTVTIMDESVCDLKPDLSNIYMDFLVKFHGRRTIFHGWCHVFYFA